MELDRVHAGMGIGSDSGNRIFATLRYVVQSCFPIFDGSNDYEAPQ